MQTKMILAGIAVVVIAGGAYAYAQYGGNANGAAAADSMMHDDAMMQDEAMAHDDSAMMEGDVMASSSDAMMHADSDSMMH